VTQRSHLKIAICAHLHARSYKVSTRVGLRVAKVLKQVG
jgi:hypothetical protein